MSQSNFKVGNGPDGGQCGTRVHAHHAGVNFGDRTLRLMLAESLFMGGLLGAVEFFLGNLVRVP